MTRKLALVVGGLLFAVVIGLEMTPASAFAAAGKRVDCGKVMSEVQAGKKASAIAKDLDISTSSVYRCKKKAGASGTKSASAKSVGGATAAPASSTKK